MGERFISAWKRTGCDDDVKERHLTLASVEDVASYFTAERMELLSHLRKVSYSSLNDLSYALERDRESVAKDIQVLIDLELVIQDKEGFRTDIDYIHATIAVK